MYNNLYYTQFEMLIESRSFTPFMRGRDVVECTTFLQLSAKGSELVMLSHSLFNIIGAAQWSDLRRLSPLHLNLEEEHEIFGDTQELM